MRKLCDIAMEIETDWGSQKNGVALVARQQLDAMHTLNSIDDDYYYDSGRMIVGSFLANACRWKGDKAKEIKKELRKMLGIK